MTRSSATQKTAHVIACPPGSDQARRAFARNNHEASTISVNTPDGRIHARVCLPPVIHPERRPIVALHGISRKHSAILKGFKDIAARTGRTLVVPHFARDDWPEFQRIGQVRPDKALWSLFSALREDGLMGHGQIDLFGFSGGAQLANRFALLYPQSIGKLHLAAAGWYCMPDESLPFPVGLGQAKTPCPHGATDIAALMRAQVDWFLRIPLRVYVGDRDIERDQALRTTRLVDKAQGMNRRERAETFVSAFRAAAQDHAITANASLAVLPGCGHDFTECARKGALAERVSF